MSAFIFENYGFDENDNSASFTYGFENTAFSFTERFEFAPSSGAYDQAALERALFLAFLLIGTSYYKTFPTNEVRFRNAQLDEWQAGFMNHVYQEGLSQFAFENNLTRSDLAQFQGAGQPTHQGSPYGGHGTLLLQSGGKDSLLSAAVLQEKNRAYDSLYIGASEQHPGLIDELPGETRFVRRHIDIESLRSAIEAGGSNGHVPVTFIVLAVGLVQAILLGKSELIASIGHEGQEPHAWIGDLPVNHQWSKTWEAEQLFAEYVARYVSPDIRVGSLLRGLSELRVAELFADKAWARFGERFSSCNRANYGQGVRNHTLSWCGDCPKCANSYLLFAPFVEPAELQALFGGRDLFTATELLDTFKGLLGVEGVMKPFECVGEVAELRTAYHMAQAKGGYGALPFTVPQANFDYRFLHPMQQWAKEYMGDL